MKMKSDFVTNSSSTAFVLIARSDLTREGVRRLLGVSEGSPLQVIADGLFRIIESDGVRIQRTESPETIRAKMGDDFTEEVINRVTAAVASGADVRLGSWSSEAEEIESLFCCESLVAENDAFYLNALQCSW